MDIKSTLTRQVGPLPLYGWMGIALGLLLVYSYAKRKDGSATTAATDTFSGYSTGSRDYTSANEDAIGVTTQGYRTRNETQDFQDSYATGDPYWTTIPETPPVNKLLIEHQVTYMPAPVPLPAAQPAHGNQKPKPITKPLPNVNRQPQSQSRPTGSRPQTPAKPANKPAAKPKPKPKPKTPPRGAVPANKL